MIRGKVIHASSVAIDGRGLLILGPSGAGKSALALALMAMGAVLVSDDRTVLRRDGDMVLADAPDSLRGLIEARGIGILRADSAGAVPVVLVVDLGRAEDAR
ncbi:MAG: HPr kinase/phosphatase C-terminal domain-containing protein, partial [Paracoccus sp. (in: a-proteobacteria)]|nr:HPr kinase/phosphatase C-terminal domain-containing protein [Paracoccus sp. (in: a-proteobacteria)]